MTPVVWFGVSLAGSLSLLLPFVLRPVLKRYGVLDHPSERSSHTRATLRGGGLAPLLGLTLGGATLVLGLAPNEDRFLALIILGAAIASGLLGLVEDVRGVPIIARAGTQLIIGAVTASVLTRLSGWHWALVPVAALAFAAYVNFTNFMDGINSISGLHGAAVGGLYALIGTLFDAPWLIGIGAATALAFAAFLPWNLSNPGMFLGDVGSYLLGAILAASAMSAIHIGIPPLVALAPMTIYLVDTVATLLRRMWKREVWHSPHRQHVYQRLVDAGWPHIASAGLVTLLTVLAGLAAILTSEGHAWIWGVVILCSLGVLYLMLPKLTAARASESP